MNEDEFRKIRKQWFADLAAKADRSNRTMESCDKQLDPVEVLAVVHYCRVAHLMGIQEERSELPGLISAAQVENVISKIWRSAEHDVSLVADPHGVFTSIMHLADELGWSDSEILRSIKSSSVAEQSFARRPTSRRSLPVDLLSSEPAFGIESTESQSSDYLTWLRLAVQKEYNSEGERWLSYFTPLEIRLAFAQETDFAELEARIAQTRLFLVYNAIPGSWPGGEGAGIPPTVAEWVVGRNGRFKDLSAGYIANWIAVMENSEEIQALQRWGYSPAYSVSRDDRSFDISIALRFEDDSHGYITYRYSASEIIDMRSLDVIALTASVRLDVYRLDETFELSYVSTTDAPIPGEVVDLILEWREGASREVNFTFPALEPRAVHEDMIFNDAANFSWLRRGQTSLKEEPNSTLALVYVEFLETTERAARYSLGSGTSSPDVPLIMELSERLAVEMSKRRQPRPSVEQWVRWFSPGTLYVQLRVFHDGGYLQAFVAGLDNSGTLLGERREFSDSVDLWSNFESVESLVFHLVEGLRAMEGLLVSGFDRVALSVDTILYNIPFHEVFLRLGFKAVTYVHRIELIRQDSSEAPSNAEVAIWSFSGRGSSYLPAVDIENGLIRTLYQTHVAPEQACAPWPEILHVSGHGVAGPDLYSSGVECGDGAWLTPSSIALTPDISRTRLVFLSACYSGALVTTGMQVPENPPMDVVLMERGVRNVISTSAPVNDIVAATFSCAFHLRFSGGFSAWESFLYARNVSSGKDDEFASVIGVRWPEWDTQFATVPEAHQGDWMLFRFSGPAS